MDRAVGLEAHVGEHGQRVVQARDARLVGQVCQRRESERGVVPRIRGRRGREHAQVVTA